MTMDRINRRVGVAAATACFIAMMLVASTASATVLKDLKLDDLIAQSDAIVIGQVLDKRSLREGGQDQIWTDSLIYVETVIKGKAPAELTIRQQGGRIGDAVMHISGNAALPVTKRAVLFLIEHEGLFFTVGMELGAYSVVLDGSGVERVERQTTVPVAIQAPRKVLEGGETILGTADASYQGVRLSEFVAEIKRRRVP